jgi:diaminopimelate decarboxylase
VSGLQDAGRADKFGLRVALVAHVALRLRRSNAIKVLGISSKIGSMRSTMACVGFDAETQLPAS